MEQDYTRFLSPEGREIYNTILNHLEVSGINNSIDFFELSVLANAFDLYAKNAEVCKKGGVSQHPERGGWDQIRPEYTVMKNEYQNILKHSKSFGLNPEARAKIFKGEFKPKKRVDINDGLD